MKLTVMTKCGPIETTGLEQEVVDEFVNDYRNGTGRVLVVPDTDADERFYATREYITSVKTGPDVDLPEPPPVDLPEPQEGDAVAPDAGEESSTA